MATVEVEIMFTRTEDCRVMLEVELPDTIDPDDEDAVHTYLDEHQELWESHKDITVDDTEVELDEVTVL
jgi:hypothetical protein